MRSVFQKSSNKSGSAALMPGVASFIDCGGSAVLQQLLCERSAIRLVLIVASLLDSQKSPSQEKVEPVKPQPGIFTLCYCTC